MRITIRRLASVRLAIAILVIFSVAGTGSYLLAGSKALSPTDQAAAPKSTLLKPYSLGMAPYQYIAYSGSLDQSRITTGVSQYFAAFIVSGPTACTPAWGGGATTGLTSQRSNEIAADFSALRESGGEVTVSFGGSNGSELATSCKTVADLTAAYKSVIDRYRLTRVDFDIEGPALLDEAANARRADAIASLRTTNPGLKVWVTLPVHTQGLTNPGLTILRQLRDRSIELNGINIMAMNYNISSKDMGSQAVSAAQEVFGQFKDIYPASSPTDIWKTMGVTVMVGHNNTVPETFTLANAKKLQAFAVSKGIGMLSIWSVGRDMACPATAAGTDVVATVPSTTCSGVVQKPYDFLRALTIPAKR